MDGSHGTRLPGPHHHKLGDRENTSCAHERADSLPRYLDPLYRLSLEHLRSPPSVCLHLPDLHGRCRFCPDRLFKMRTVNILNVSDANAIRTKFLRMFHVGLYKFLKGNANGVRTRKRTVEILRTIPTSNLPWPSELLPLCTRVILKHCGIILEK